MGNPVVHFEVLGPDGPKLQTFYADLFGWQIQNMPDMGNYGLVDTAAGQGINGAVGAVQEGGPPNMRTIYITVADPQATLDKIESLGGKTVVPVTAIPNVVTFAQFADPQGAIVGLVKDDAHEHAPGEEHDHGPSKGSGAPVGWFEIVSGEPEAQRDFYTSVFDWTIASTTETEFKYYEVATKDDRGGINGGIGSAQDGQAAVNIWAEVSDPAAALAKAESLGATKVMEPMQVPNGPLLAGFLDPAGNFFGVYKQ